MRGRLDARRTLKSLVADLRIKGFHKLPVSLIKKLQELFKKLQGLFKKDLDLFRKLQVLSDERLRTF